MTAKKKFDWAEFTGGLKTIFSRNALLIIGINATNQFSNNMKNGFRTLIGIKEIGIAPTAIGAIVSVFMIAGLIFRTPAGGIVDTKRSKIKQILTIALLAKVAVFAAFGFVHSQAAYTALFVVDGIVWSFIGTSLPALLALSVDRRAMGSAYAVFMGITQVISGSARPLGISLYNNYGARTAAFASAGITLLTVLLVLLLNGEKLAEGAAKMKAPKPGEKKSKLAGFSVRLLPLAIVAAVPILLFNLESNFLPGFAEETGYEYLVASGIGGTINGVLTIVVGFLCDFMSPSLLIYIGLLGQVIGGVLMGTANSSSMLSLGVLIYYMTRFYSTPFRIIGMKACTRDEQGAWSATQLVCNDALSVCANWIFGILIGLAGYAKVFTGTGIAVAIAMIGYFILDRSYLKKLGAADETAEVKAKAAPNAAS